VARLHEIQAVQCPGGASLRRNDPDHQDVVTEGEDIMRGLLLGVLLGTACWGALALLARFLLQC
jgi:hypothetical protein